MIPLVIFFYYFSLKYTITLNHNEKQYFSIIEFLIIQFIIHEFKSCIFCLKIRQTGRLTEKDYFYLVSLYTGRRGSHRSLLLFYTVVYRCNC